MKKFLLTSVIILVLGIPKQLLAQTENINLYNSKIISFTDMKALGMAMFTGGAFISITGTILTLSSSSTESEVLPLNYLLIGGGIQGCIAGAILFSIVIEK